MEYSGEEQAIVAVGLARPKPGVFVEAIQHLLVLCTSTEVRGLDRKTGLLPPGASSCGTSFCTSRHRARLSCMGDGMCLPHLQLSSWPELCRPA